MYALTWMADGNSYPEAEALYKACENEDIEDTTGCFDEEDIDGISYKFESEEVCPYGTTEDATFSFTVNIICDETVTDEGAGVIDSASFTNTCDPTVNMRHASGCPAFSALGMANWLDKNAWFTGILLLGVGGFVALFGTKYFAHVMGVFAGMCAFSVVILIASLFGWMSSTGGMIVFIIVAILAGLGGGYAMFKLKTASFMFLGVAGGWFAGSFITTFFYAITGWDSMWWLILLSLIFMIIGGYCAYKYHEKLL